MLPRLRVRIPLWAALTIPVAAYATRSLLLRGGDFSPDLPQDAIVGALVVAAVVLVGVARRTTRDDEATEDAHRDA